MWNWKGDTCGRNLIVCLSDMISQLELEKPEQRPVKRANGIFWIILLNLGIYVADHLFQVPKIIGFISFAKLKAAWR